MPELRIYGVSRPLNASFIIVVQKGGYDLKLSPNLCSVSQVVKTSLFHGEGGEFDSPTEYQVSGCRCDRFNIVLFGGNDA